MSLHQHMSVVMICEVHIVRSWSGSSIFEILGDDFRGEAARRIVELVIFHRTHCESRWTTSPILDLLAHARQI